MRNFPSSFKVWEVPMIISYISQHFFRFCACMGYSNENLQYFLFNLNNHQHTYLLPRRLHESFNTNYLIYMYCPTSYPALDNLFYTSGGYPLQLHELFTTLYAFHQNLNFTIKVCGQSSNLLNWIYGSHNLKRRRPESKTASGTLRVMGSLQFRLINFGPNIHGYSFKARRFMLEACLASRSFRKSRCSPTSTWI